MAKIPNHNQNQILHGIVINYPMFKAEELDRFFELLDTKEKLSGLSEIVKKASIPLAKMNPLGYSYIQKILIIHPFNFLDFIDCIIEDQVWELPDEDREDINYLTKVFLNIALIVNRQLFIETELDEGWIKFLYHNLLLLMRMEPSKDSVLAPMAQYVRDIIR